MPIRELNFDDNKLIDMLKNGTDTEKLLAKYVITRQICNIKVVDSLYIYWEMHRLYNSVKIELIMNKYINEKGIIKMIMSMFIVNVY
jgi:hypothetical protein